MESEPAMDGEASHPRSDLFVLRVWREDMGEGRIEWRGKVQHILTGDARYFRGWSGLIEVLLRMLSDLGRTGS
jgi:hypothetical protein